jgi:hypothetical protein
LLSPAGFNQQAPNSGSLSRLPLASGPRTAPAECSRSRRPARRAILRCGSCIQRVLATRHQLTNDSRNGSQHHPASSIQHRHSSCPSVRCRLSRPHQVSCPLQTPSSQQIHTQHTGRWPSRPRGSCRGFGHAGHRCAIRRFYLFVGGFGRPRALHGHSPRASAGRSGRRHFGGSGRAQLRQVSCQRTACASSPLLNPSCTQAIAEVRPFAGRSRHRCAGKRPLHLLRGHFHARRLTRLADGFF